MNATARHSRRTSHRVITTSVLFSMLALFNLAVDTSCTGPPKCSVGEHAVRAPSHQGHMWNCVPVQVSQ
jgi:hypothetical protein